MLVNAGFNIFVIFKYPGYEDAQRKDAQAEIKDYLAANPAFANQFVAIGVKAGVDFARNNPDVAKEIIFNTSKGGNGGGYANV